MNLASAYSSHRSGQDADVLISQHAELVKRIAWHLAGRLPASVDVEDLIQAGMLGLLEAAEHFVADRGARFETYAGIRIRGSMIDSLRRLDWAPRSVHRKAREAALALREIEAELGRGARDLEVADKMGISLDDYHRVMQDSTTCQLSSFDESPVVDAIDSANPLDDVLAAGFREALTQAIENLPEREKLVMSLYYDDELNLKEIGAVLNVTESRACQLHGQAVVRLKARLGPWRDRLEAGS